MQKFYPKLFVTGGGVARELGFQTFLPACLDPCALELRMRAARCLLVSVGSFVEVTTLRYLTPQHLDSLFDMCVCVCHYIRG